ncbi:LicD family protein [Hydrogenimonas cancrithermarum]|uniref:Phosphorylcholine transferase LicD n=1 Tax=Hydrogenimonas cancrithermarum TaxID=2993563 RepID=A0ABN6WWC8_9BACT|nr:LicD family protein [Hydrogenimonas cancrithermarum]BDY13445.1 phosphorylcholine transferase LicD [Hydrogenimonas cancrithermarum]
MNETVQQNENDFVISDELLKDAQAVMFDLLKEIDRICKKHDIKYWLDGGTLLGAVRHQGFIPWDDDIDIAMMREDYTRFMEVAPKELPENMFLQTKETDPGYFNLVARMKVRDKNSLILEDFESGDEPYHLGLFVDIFPYDHLPSEKSKRKFYKYLSKKIIKFQKFKLEKKGLFKDGNVIYFLLGPFFSYTFLENTLQRMIEKTNRENSEVIGFGLDCVLTRVYDKKEFFPLDDLPFVEGDFPVPKNWDYYLRTTYGDYMQLPPEEEQRPRHIKKCIPRLNQS